MNRRTAITALVGTAAAACGVTTARAGTHGAGATTGAKATSAKAVGLLYDATMCVGCLACVSGCAEAQAARMAEEGRLYQESRKLTPQARTAVRTVKHGEAECYMKQQCMHCIDPGCVSACMMGALSKDERGIVSWDGDRCVGCRYCQVACPFNVPRFEWNNARNPRIVKCEMCWPRQDKGERPACVESCPAEAVIFGKREELLTEAHRRLKESPEGYVPRILGERDAGGTQVMMLSSVSFAELGVPDVGDEPIPQTVRDVQGTLYNGFIAPTVLYGVLAAVVWRNHRMTPETNDGPEEAEHVGPR